MKSRITHITLGKVGILIGFEAQYVYDWIWNKWCKGIQVGHFIIALTKEVPRYEKAKE